MDVELLVVADCPHEAPATQLLRAVLPDLGLSPDSFRTIVIRTDDEAQQRHFRGSPTFLIDGTDPFAEPGQPIGLGCRIYRSGSGRDGRHAARFVPIDGIAETSWANVGSLSVVAG